jgi:hypothetical protein
VCCAEACARWRRTGLRERALEVATAREQHRDEVCGEEADRRRRRLAQQQVAGCAEHDRDRERAAADLDQVGHDLQRSRGGAVSEGQSVCWGGAGPSRVCNEKQQGLGVHHGTDWDWWSAKKVR